MGKINKRQILFMALMVIVSISTFAVDGGKMPWETALDRITGSLTGPVATAIATISIVVAGLGFAFGDGGGIQKKLLQIVLGIGIALSASVIITKVFDRTNAGIGLSTVIEYEENGESLEKESTKKIIENNNLDLKKEINKK